MKKLTALVLTLSMLLSMLAIPMGATAADAETDNRVWFDLNGNSKLFMEYSTDPKSAFYKKPDAEDYVPGVDYTGHLAAPTGVFAVDKAKLPANHACFTYTVNESRDPSGWTKPNFTTDASGNTIWTVDGVDYRIDTDSEVIKLVDVENATTEGITSADLNEARKTELIEKFESLEQGVTVSVEAGNYKEIGVLAGCFSASTPRQYSITFIYDEGAPETVTTTGMIGKAQGTYNWASGAVAFARFDSTDYTYGSAYGSFTGLTFTPNATRTLKGIKFTPAEKDDKYGIPVFVVSAYGIMMSFNDYAAEINAEINAIDVNTVTEEECAALRQKIEDLIAKSNGALIDADFDTTKLDEAEEKLIDKKAKELVSVPKVTQFPLSAATGANSRLFVLKGEESNIATSGYLKGIDFYGRLGDSNTTDPETDYYISYSMYDETANQTPLIFKEDAKGKYVEITHYEEETKKYYVNPDEKVIKVTPVVATADYYGENAAAAASLNGCTINVPHGKYQSIGYLAGSTGNRTPAITLIYEDGEESASNVPGVISWGTFRGASETDTYKYYANTDATQKAQRGIFQFSKVEDLATLESYIGYKEATVTVDPDRVLTAIKFASGDRRNPISIISLWGNGESISEKLAKLGEIEVTDATYASAKTAIAEFDAYLADLGYTVNDLGSYKAPYTSLLAEIAEYEAERAEIYGTLKLKTNFPLSEVNGANAKLFMPDATYQIYKTNQNVTEEWVKGLDYSGLANVDDKHTANPTGTDKDIITSGKNSAFVYKINDKSAAYWEGFVNLVKKDDDLTWTVDGTDFVIDPDQKVVKVYTPTNAEGVQDAALRERFETLDNPAFDIEDGYYDSITLLAGSIGASGTLTPTVIYEDGNEEALTGALTKGGTYASGDNQDDGWLYLQGLTPDAWTNTNAFGGIYFGPMTLTGFDKTKKVDKISFKSNTYGNAIFVISAFGESASISQILNSADIKDYDSIEYALNTVDAILEQNNIEVSDLTEALEAKYNELKAAKEAMPVFKINEIALKNNTVTVNYTNSTAADVDALLIVAQYSSNGKVFISVKTYPVSLTTDRETLTREVQTTAGNKVKIFVWRSLADLFPLTSNIYNN